MKRLLPIGTAPPGRFLSGRFCRMDKRTEQAERENIPYFRQPRHQEPEAELHEILRADNDADVYRGRQAGDLSESLSVPLLWRLIRWHLATFRARAYQ